MFTEIKSSISRNITNIKGWRTDRKIIVIESDDWGSIRMPNMAAYKRFINLGYDISKDPYCRVDTLANTEDLEALFEVLKMFKDNNGHHPKFTFNTVMANPLFDEIRESEYNNYCYEPFSETLKRYYPNDNVLELWKQGIKEKLILPQFHGREHVNVPLWLNYLKDGNKPLLEAFALGYWGIPKSFYGSNNVNIQASFGSYGVKQLEFYRNNIREGLQLFEDVFDFKSKTFIANNYTYPQELDLVLSDAEVVGIQGIRKQKIPMKNGSIALKEIYTGKTNKWKQKYTVRNAIFEPSQMPKTMDNVGNCLKEINNSFFWKKPAIISSHRLNYIGSIDAENRRCNLEMLKDLFDQIIKRWPDVEFLSSDELVEILN